VSHPYPQEWHRFLVRIPPEPPRPLTARVWLAWLVHSYRTRFAFYFALMPAFLLVIARDAMERAIRHPASALDVILLLMMLGPIAACVAAGIEAVRFARLVRGGTSVITRTHQVQAEAGRAGAHYGGGRFWSFPVTDVVFEYQGARDGVNIQGVWKGRIRYRREPAERQTMPVLFDPARPERRLVLWAYGLTIPMGDDQGRAGA
jgi:hypothetical protein